jgi:hypothetical protein
MERYQQRELDFVKHGSGCWAFIIAALGTSSVEWSFAQTINTVFASFAPITLPQLQKR